MTQVSIPDAMRLAVEHHRSNRLPEAETIYRQVLAVQPANPDALYLLGVVAQQVGRHADAVGLLRRAVPANPRNAAWRSTLGVSLALAGDVDEAVHQFEQSIILDPDLPDAHLNLGNAFNLRGQRADAIRCFRHAIRLKPDYAEAHFNLANALSESGQAEESVEHYRAVTRLRPKVVVAHLQLADALRRARRLDDSVAAYRRAIDLDPSLAEARYNLGVALAEAGRREAAIEAFREAVALKPDLAAARFALVTALGEGAPVEEQVAELRAGLEAEPDNRAALDALLQLSQYVPGADRAALFEQHLEWARRFEQPLLDAAAAALAAGPAEIDQGATAAASADDAGRRLRIGYVSRDFRAHPVGFFIEPVIAAHDRSRFEVFCYADDVAPDDTTARLRRTADVWRDVTRMDEAQLADQIRVDRVDILVDLAGHTEGNRLLAFARRPAPMQVTWVGYPDTTGMRSMDLRVTDAHADPPGGDAERHHTERLLRLPCAWCYRPPEPSPPVEPPPSDRFGGAGGVPQITFGCFNMVRKVNGPLIAAWARVLLGVPGSRLLLKARWLDREDVRRRLVGAFAARGIGPSRLELLPPTPSLDEHLRAYGRVDIALDTHPYAGTSTTCEALWMGVPVVTLTGRTSASRIGASFLTLLGLEELVAADVQSYVRAAVELARDVETRRELRHDLRPRMMRSTLLDSRAFTRALEHRLREEWRTLRSPRAASRAGR